MQASELILNADGSIYHLGLLPGQLAEKIILVGDQDRVDTIGKHLEKVEFIHQKREFRSLTGWYQGQRISVVSTGIGADNVDIVWHEIDALVNLDLASGKPLTVSTRLKALRLGTCGGMQPSLPPGSLVFSRFSLGADGLLDYYQLPSYRGPLAKFNRHWQQFRERSGLEIDIYPAMSDPDLSSLIQQDFPHIHSGITFTAKGFYGPQGRSLGRLPLRWPDLPERIAMFHYPEEGLSVLNMEMESSAVQGLGMALGHQAGTICTIMANRRKGTFAAEPAAEIEKLIATGLEVLNRWE
jgi:uridine phosphorylase